MKDFQIKTISKYMTMKNPTFLSQLSVKNEGLTIPSLSFSQVDIKHVTKLSTILRNLRQNHSSRDTHEAPADLKTKHLPKAFAIA